MSDSGGIKKKKGLKVVFVFTVFIVIRKISDNLPAHELFNKNKVSRKKQFFVVVDPSPPSLCSLIFAGIASTVLTNQREE